MGYKILEFQNLPESIKNKPGWVSCMAFTAAVLVVTVSALTVGLLLGYTYCYIEHRTTVTTGNVTKSTNLQIVHMPYPETEEANRNRTINGAILSSVIVSRIMNIGNAIMDDELASIPFSQHEHASNSLYN